MTFECQFADSHSSLTTRWLIEPDKVCITDGNVSTNETKYKPLLYKEGPRYIYTLTLHNSSITDLGTYICEVGFQSTLITFAINDFLPFICEYSISYNFSFAYKKLVNIHKTIGNSK